MVQLASEGEQALHAWVEAGRAGLELRPPVSLADPDTDEVYAQMTLQPLNTYGKEALQLSELALKHARPQMEFFCKTLTASDTSTHGGFSSSLCLAVLQRRYYLNWTSVCSLRLKNFKPDIYMTMCGYFAICFEVSRKDIY